MIPACLHVYILLAGNKTTKNFWGNRATAMDDELYTLITLYARWDTHAGAYCENGSEPSYRPVQNGTVLGSAPAPAPIRFERKKRNPRKSQVMDTANGNTADTQSTAATDQAIEAPSKSRDMEHHSSPNDYDLSLLLLQCDHPDDIMPNLRFRLNDF
jgi:hypothetical protein